MNLFKKLRLPVFLPPFFLLIISLILSLTNRAQFLEKANQINSFIIENFGFLFELEAFLLVVTCIVILMSPIGSLRIGGKNAQPLLTKWRWFSIVLCTTIATGILFWGTAEPVFHLINPTNSLSIDPLSKEAGIFSLSTLYLHWSFTPYAIYTVPALLFAIAFYNQKKTFSLHSTLFPFRLSGRIPYLAEIIDAICLFALVAGMAASLGGGILILSGGVDYFRGIDSGNFTLLLIAILIVTSFVVSASTGLMKGIRFLSDINLRIFILLLLFVFFTSSIGYLLLSFSDAIWLYITQFLNKSTFMMQHPDDPWAGDWTVFYWANWMAWAPITSLFLGRVSYGYTVREFMITNWVLPSLFAILWMSIFGGSTLDMYFNQEINLPKILEENGPESIIYQLFSTLPFQDVLVIVFLLTAFISYVTAADSNTEAMSGISATGITPESASPPIFIKIIWGVTIGITALVMVSYAGIDGIRILSNIGGLPSLILIIFINIAMFKFIISFRNRK